VFDVVVIGVRFDEAVAEARLSDARLTALLLRTSWANNGHVQRPQLFCFASHLFLSSGVSLLASTAAIDALLDPLYRQSVSIISTSVSAEIGRAHV